MIGLLLAGLVYWGCTVVVLHFDAYGEKMAAAASLPKIVVQLFGVGALWIACVIGYLACFASLNIYIQSFARLVWSQAQHNPDHYLARLSSPRHIPNNALNAVLGCCVVEHVGDSCFRDQSGRSYHLCQWHLYYDLSVMHAGRL
ncbi:hypothetical protein ACLK2F_23345 [Escherichia coli]